MGKKIKKIFKSGIFYLASAALIALLFFNISLAGCKTQESKPASITNVTADEVYKMLSSNKDYFILDVRSKEEFDSGHIEGAYLLHVSELENRLAELPQDKPIIVYCRSGSRSTSAANILLEKGFKEIFNMTGGITEWQSKGFPVIVEK
jgi:rhodanese-related sulfurtransferase